MCLRPCYAASHPASLSLLSRERTSTLFHLIKEKHMKKTASILALFGSYLVCCMLSSSSGASSRIEESGLPIQSLLEYSSKIC